METLVDFLTKSFDILTKNELEAMSNAIYIDDDSDPEDNDVYQVIGEDLHAETHEGVSKLVLEFPEFDDIVIKVPFLGHVTVGDSFFDDPAYENYWSSSYPDAEFIIDNFDIRANTTLYHGAKNCGRFDVPANDYCAAEAYVSKDIPEDIVDMFCRTFYLFTYEHYGVTIPVYYSEKADSAYYYGSVDVSQNSRDSAKKYRCAYKFGSDACATFIEQYGEEKVSKLYDFLDEYMIGDLHDGNVMFNSDGKLVVVDFSDFNG